MLFARFVFVGLFIGSASVLASPGSVVFNSFKDRSLALKESAQISRQFGIEARIEEARVNGLTYHRVLGPLMDQASAGELIRQARAGGLADVWVLSSKERPVVRMQRQVPELKAPVSKSVVELPTSQPQSVDAAPQESNDQSAMSARVVNADSLSNQQSGTMRIARVDAANIKIDGLVDEAIWSEIPAFDRMIVSEPDTLEKPTHKTKTRILYTDKGLYVAGEMEQPPDTLVERLSSRDESINRDELGFAIDSSGKGLYGYFFRLALGGSKTDGKIAPEDNLTNQWDGPWVGETAVTDKGWSAEMFIPWSALSMPDEAMDRQISISLLRKVAYMDETYTWPPLPRSQARFISAFKPVPVEGVNPRQQWEVYPYASATSDEIRNEADGRGGIDVAWRPSSNLQLTATVNPDFGSVESDDAVVNLTAYETFYPEKRLFFLEGNEVFLTSPRSNVRTMSSSRGGGGRQSASSFTMEPSTLLNTRRIGGSAKQVVVPESVEVSGVELGKPSELIGAVKAVGQSGNLRYGILSAFEKEAELIGTDEETGLEVPVKADGRDFGVVRLLYENASGGGRNSLGYMGTIASNPLDDALVHGVDSHWLSKSGKWSWDGQLMMSDKEDDKGYGLFADIGWKPKRGVGHSLSLDWLDDQLDISDLGFLRRNDVVGASYRYFRSTSTGLSDRLRNKRLMIFSQAHFNTDGQLTNSYTGIRGEWLTRKNIEFSARLSFKPPQYDDRNSRGNGVYRTDYGFYSGFTIGTDSARKFSVSAGLDSRPEDLGEVTFIPTVGFTYTPIDRFSLDFDVMLNKRNEWVLYKSDENLTSYDALEVRPMLSMNFFISSKQQLSLKFQWIGIDANESHFWSINKEAKDLVPRFKDLSEPTDDFTVSRLTAQVRYRWEIGPLSDLFIVYTRGSNLPNRVNDEFWPLFQDSIDEPIIDVFTMKLRYRFGS